MGRNDTRVHLVLLLLRLCRDDDDAADYDGNYDDNNNDNDVVSSLKWCESIFLYYLLSVPTM
jgi:hypothetical protein